MCHRTDKYMFDPVRSSGEVTNENKYSWQPANERKIKAPARNQRALLKGKMG